MVSALQNSLTRRMSRSRSSVKRPPKQLACGRTGSRCDNSADRLTHRDAMHFGSLNGTVKLVSLPGRCQDRWSAGDLPQSIVKLHYTPPPAENAPGRLDAVAWFTPFHDSDRNPHGQDNFQDYDLGSAGPLAIPGMGLVVEAAEAAANPMSLAFALYADGFAFREVDPARALDAVRRGLIIAQDSGNRLSETQLALTLGRLAADHSDIASAFDHLTLAIRNTHDAGDTTNIKNPLAAVAALFYGLDATSRRPSSLVSRSAPSPHWRSPNSIPRSLTSAMSSATRPTNRSPAKARR